MIAIKLSTDVNTSGPLGELIGNTIVYFSMFVILIILPSGFLMIICFDEHILRENPYFIAAYGQLYKEIRIKTTMQRLCTFFVLLRRVLFLKLALTMHDVPVSLKIFGITILHIVTMFYNGFSKPYAGQLDQRLQQFNEYMVGVSIFCLFPLSDWNLLAEDRYYYSWILIIMVQVMVFVNMTIVIKMSYKSIKLLLFKYKRLIMIRYLKRIHIFLKQK